MDSKPIQWEFESPPEHLDRAPAVRDNGGMPIKNGPKKPVTPTERIPPERLAAATTVPYDFPASDRRRKIADMARRMYESSNGFLQSEDAFQAATDFVDYEERWMAQQQGK